MKYLILLMLCANCTMANFAQGISVNTDGSAANSSAMLDVKSNDKGMLIPRMSTAQREAIQGPAAGLMVFDITEKTLYMFDGQQWLGFAALTKYQRPANNLVYGPDALDTLFLGYSVSMWDQFAAISAPYKRTGNIITGAVYIYKIINGSWQYFTTLLPSGNSEGCFFGASVNMKGNYLAVGAPYHKNAGNSDVGAVYVYNYNGSAWVLQQTIFGSNASSAFGTLVAINQAGTTLAVSEPDLLINGLSNVGAVRVYAKQAATFLFLSNILDQAPVAQEHFGSAMAMSPNGLNVIVGAAAKDVGGQLDHGFIGHYVRTGNSWNMQNGYAPAPEFNLRIGEFVDISDTKAVYSIGKTRSVKYMINIVGQWQPLESNYPDPINGVTIDPVTEEFYVYSANKIYLGLNGPTVIRTLAIDRTGFSYENLLTAYNKKYAAGMPYGANLEKAYVGGVYFGVDETP